MIQMINFWPDMQLDDYINLKARVETRMKALVMASTGDDNLLSPEEQGDLEYRREQLQRLQTEVVDLEDMNSGVSITDLGLNEFRMELMEYAKQHPELEKTPGGISAVTSATPDAPAGIIFILKNVHQEVNVDNRNRLHPYYLVYLVKRASPFMTTFPPRPPWTLCGSCVVAKPIPFQNSTKPSTRRRRTGETWQFTLAYWRMPCCPL